MHSDNCNNQQDCIPYEEYIKVVELARAYVPFQKLCGIFDLNEGLIQGTIFPELASPYCKGDSNLIKEENPCNKKNPCERRNPCERNSPCENTPSPFPIFR